ncbi:hypothetical protein K1T71_004727 [Dendrolimus kikuchii]|uniref:Uncharacterized protein n=1 Tax=Dendrolimus kikuchii TaxID=765133 RepID=A0ACC1D8X9_9NEOP|nr:hypothetical protein K1T71_004727 [Dendrolimus kikuchii]
MGFLEFLHMEALFEVKMADVIQRASQCYKYLFDELSDPRSRNWMLMDGPGPILTIVAAYLYFCSYAGPIYMKDRKPYRLKNVMMWYNLFQIAMSVFLTYRGIEYIIQTDYRFTCQNIDYSDNPIALTWVSSVWWYFFAKLTELLDTVFFVLRKKNNQVSFLHLYHHSMMPVLTWYGSKYTPGGQAIPEGTLNSFIHVLMYTYYFMAGLGPQYQKYLWWKKYLTSLQLIQFCIVLYTNITGLFAENCNYPKYLNYIVLFNCTAFLYMFGMFYYQNYVKNNKKLTKKLTEQKES